MKTVCFIQCFHGDGLIWTPFSKKQSTHVERMVPADAVQFVFDSPNQKPSLILLKVSWFRRKLGLRKVRKTRQTLQQQTKNSILKQNHVLWSKITWCVSCRPRTLSFGLRVSSNHKLTFGWKLVEDWLRGRQGRSTEKCYSGRKSIDRALYTVNKIG